MRCCRTRPRSCGFAHVQGIPNGAHLPKFGCEPFPGGLATTPHRGHSDVPHAHGWGLESRKNRKRHAYWLGPESQESHRVEDRAI